MAKFLALTNLRDETAYINIGDNGEHVLVLGPDPYGRTVIGLSSGDEALVTESVEVVLDRIDRRVREA